MWPFTIIPPSFLASQVLVTLDHLERVSTFQEFVQIFSQFGNEMVEFAHLTGDRQNVSSVWSFKVIKIILEQCIFQSLSEMLMCLKFSKKNKK